LSRESGTMSLMQSLTKGANAPVDAASVRVALSWSMGSAVPDVDVSALLCSTSGTVSSDADFVFFNQTTHPSGTVRHRGKVHAAAAVSDNLEVDLDRVPVSVEKVVIAASADGGTFGQVPGLRVDVIDAAGTTLLRFAMTAQAETAFIVGELYRRGGAWKFRAIAQGYVDGLAGLARDFGITIDDPGPQHPPPSPTPPTPRGPEPSRQPSAQPGVHPSPGRPAGIDWLNPPVPAGYEN
jgi:tellurite resistance protein TerA